MKLSSAIALLAATTTASARTIAQPRAALAPYFYTIGDSTVTETAGWGQGFREFTNGASGENRAVSGTTTVSWKSNGRWADLLEAIGTKNTTHRVIVTLQWGHNDQKSTTGITLDDYRENIVNYVKDLKAVGATPVGQMPTNHRHLLRSNPYRSSSPRLLDALSSMAKYAKTLKIGVGRLSQPPKMQVPIGLT